MIGQQRGSDGRHRVFMAGDGEKNNPLFIESEGVGKRVKSASMGIKVDELWLVKRELLMTCEVSSNLLSVPRLAAA
jgi:hypothetical protein